MPGQPANPVANSANPLDTWAAPETLLPSRIGSGVRRNERLAQIPLI